MFGAFGIDRFLRGQTALGVLSSFLIPLAGSQLLVVLRAGFGILLTGLMP